MQNRTWKKVWIEVQVLGGIAGAEVLTPIQERIVQGIVEKYLVTPKRKVKKNGKKRAYTRKAKVDGGSQETPVVAKKRGRKPKAISTADASSEPETVGAQGAHGEPWEV